jgi:hypothetical protein
MTRAINVLGVISPRPTVVTTMVVCTVSYFLCQSVIVFGSIPLKCSPVGTKHHEQYDRYT